MKFTHPSRQAPQYAYSDRDIAYLERNGWVREIPEDIKEARPILTLPKRKPKANK